MRGKILAIVSVVALVAALTAGTASATPAKSARTTKSTVLTKNTCTACLLNMVNINQMAVKTENSVKSKPKRSLTCSICVVWGTSPLIGTQPTPPVVWTPPPPPPTDCTPHQGVNDAINEERTEWDSERGQYSVFLVKGVRCNDGTEFIYEKDYIGPAPGLEPAPSAGLGMVISGSDSGGGGDTSADDGGTVDCTPYWDGENSDPWPGGC